MSVAENLARLEERIGEACLRAGRSRTDVTLIAVSKTVEPARVLQAYDAGVRDFGENRLQEALGKVPELPGDITWHFIGKLQSNKAKRATEQFSVIHTLETDSQLKEIQKGGREIVGFVEVNVAEEPQKAGILPEALDETLEQIAHYECVRLKGLMTVGPYDPDAERSRSTFRKLAALAAKHGLPWLSMGMSNDFEVAIQEGSTHIRLGTALFGDRT